MSNAIEQARARLNESDEFVKLVTWDHGLQTCARKELPYKQAKRLAAMDEPGGRYEHRIILISAY